MKRNTIKILCTISALVALAGLFLPFIKIIVDVSYFDTVKNLYRFTGDAQGMFNALVYTLPLFFIALAVLASFFKTRVAAVLSIVSLIAMGIILIWIISKMGKIDFGIFKIFSYGALMYLVGVVATIFTGFYGRK
ncbi:MAG: hypothetical protein WCL54_07970 [Clostridia bacterium]